MFTLLCGCATQTRFVLPVSGVSSGPFVLGCSYDTVTSGTQLLPYPPIQHLFNAVPGSILNVGLPSGDIADGTILFLICDNEPHISTFFAIHQSDNQKTLLLNMRGTQTHILIYGKDHRWLEFESE
jgi:hypothetical protein